MRHPSAGTRALAGRRRALGSSKQLQPIPVTFSLAAWRVEHWRRGWIRDEELVYMLATMTDATTESHVPAAPRLWTPEGFREDEWTHAEGAEALSGNGRFILPLPAFLGLDPQQRGSARERLGVLLQPGDRLESLADLLDQLSLVALAFPAFSDGRSFSKAELLRSRYHFEGPIRATGQVLVDQLPHMLRLGFSEFEVSHPVLIRRLEAGKTGGVPLHYQPAARPSGKGQKYSWRRVRDS